MWGLGVWGVWVFGIGGVWAFGIGIFLSINGYGGFVGRRMLVARKLERRQ